MMIEPPSLENIFFQLRLLVQFDIQLMTNDVELPYFEINDPLINEQPLQIIFFIEGGPIIIPASVYLFLIVHLLDYTKTMSLWGILNHWNKIVIVFNPILNTLNVVKAVKSCQIIKTLPFCWEWYFMGCMPKYTNYIWVLGFVLPFGFLTCLFCNYHCAVVTNCTHV